MNDQTLAVLIGAATVVVLRIVDFFFPKNKWFGWGGNLQDDDEEPKKPKAKKKNTE